MGMFRSTMEGGKVIKYLVLFFNFLFFIFGIALLGAGAYAEAKFGSLTNLSTVDFASGSRLLIAVGVIIAFIAFFGCCGAWKENKCLLITFFALLLVMVILEITGASLAYQHRNKLEESLKKDMNTTLMDYYGKDKVRTEAVDFGQREGKCCGIMKWQDWANVPGYNLTKVPDSCCVEKFKGCGESFFKTKHLIFNPRYQLNIWERGCYKELTKVIRERLGVVAGVAVAILLIQILGMVFSICLIRKISAKGTYA